MTYKWFETQSCFDLLGTKWEIKEIDYAVINTIYWNIILSHNEMAT